MITEQLVGHEVFEFLRSDQVNTISEAAEVVDYEAGDTVYYKGGRADFLFVVLEYETPMWVEEGPVAVDDCGCRVPSAGTDGDSLAPEPDVAVTRTRVCTGLDPDLVPVE